MQTFLEAAGCHGLLLAAKSSRFIAALHVPCRGAASAAATRAAGPPRCLQQQPAPGLAGLEPALLAAPGLAEHRRQQPAQQLPELAALVRGLWLAGVV